MIPVDPRQQLFAVKFVECGNATEAYKHAFNTTGLKDSTIYTNSSILRNNPIVATMILDLQVEVSEKLLVSEDSILLEYARIGLSDPRKLFEYNGSVKNIQDIDNDTAHAIQSIKMDTNKHGITTISEVKFWPKIPALEALAKRLGFFKDGDSGLSVAEELRQLADTLPD